MSLQLYASACISIETELIKSLTKEDIDDLRTRCAALGLERVLRWADMNFHAIAALIESPPSARLKHKAWNEPDVKSLLVFGAICEVRYARVFLAILSERGHEIEPGLSYRRMATNAADLYHEICLAKVEY